MLRGGRLDMVALMNELRSTSQRVPFRLGGCIFPWKACSIAGDGLWLEIKETETASLYDSR
jgi:hypothetical protein